MFLVLVVVLVLIQLASYLRCGKFSKCLMIFQWGLTFGTDFWSTFDLAFTTFDHGSWPLTLGSWPLTFSGILSVLQSEVRSFHTVCFHTKRGRKLLHAKVPDRIGRIGIFITLLFNNAKLFFYICLIQCFAKLEVPSKCQNCRKQNSYLFR